MNNQLGDLLAPWAKVSTWNSGHSLDDARFHRAIHAIARELGTQIDAADFRHALSSLAGGADDSRGESSELVHAWTSRAMIIFDYLSDTEHGE